MKNTAAGLSEFERAQLAISSCRQMQLAESKLPRWLRATANIINIMQASGNPLTDAQESMLSGALAVWIECEEKGE